MARKKLALATAEQAAESAAYDYDAEGQTVADSSVFVKGDVPQAAVDYAQIARQAAGRIRVTEPSKMYLSLLDPELNAVFGTPEKGLFNGQLIELRGTSSSGKT